MRWLSLVLLVSLVERSWSIMAPMKTPSGSIDFDSVLSHVTLLEKGMEALKQDSKARNVDITELKKKVASLESKVGSGQLAVEVKSLKDELFGTRTELRSLSTEVISANSGLQTMFAKYAVLQTRMNDTGRSVEHLKVSAESGLQVLNTTLQAHVKGMAGEVNRNKHSLISIEKHLAAINASNCVIGTEQNATKRLQDKTSKIQVELNSTASTLGHLKMEFDAALRKLSTTDKRNALLKDAVSKLNGTALTMTTNFQHISQAITRVTSIVDRLNIEVSFEATSPSRHTPRRITKFTDVKHNVGGGYDSRSGKFVAPVSGIYLFWSQIEKQNGSEGRVFLYHNAAVIGYSYTPVDGIVTGTAIAAAQVAAGDSVHVGTETSHVGNSSMSSFGGVLLRRH